VKITDAIHEFILYKQIARHDLQAPGTQTDGLRPLGRTR
jgi:hypothetical protein